MTIKAGWLITEKGETVDAVWQIEDGKLVSVGDETDVEYLRVEPEFIIMLGEYLKSQNDRLRKTNS